MEQNQISKLAIGTVQFGLNYGIANASGQVSPQEASQILKLANRKGITVLDTAIAYGESEQTLGSNDLTGFEVVTKLPSLPNDVGDVRSWAMSELDASLKRLGQETVDALLLHNSSDLKGEKARELYSALQAIKYSERAKKIGWSIYGPQDLDEISESFLPDIIQVPINIFDQRMASSGALQKLKERGVEIHARSAFLQGLLLMAPNTRPEYFDQWKNIWKIWDRHLGQNQTSALATCLAYSMSIPEIDRVVIGVDSSEQLEEILSLDLDQNALPDISKTPMPEPLINPSLWNIA